MSVLSLVRKSVLIVSDSQTDTDLVKTLLDEHFDEVAVSGDVLLAARDFERERPKVLLLAFKDLRKSENFYLSLYRHHSASALLNHRTVILCDKQDLKQAFELCRRALFDDYVLFWPITHDVTRLRMSVHRALEEIDESTADNLSASTIALQAARIMELEKVLSEQLALGREHIASTGRVVADAERDVALSLVGGESVLPHFRKVSQSLQPLSRWAGEMQQTVSAHGQSARALADMAAGMRAVVLVVDDDEFQRSVTGQILQAEGYQPKFATTGTEALGLLCRFRPDLILMDYQLPDMSGVEVTKRVKAQPRLASVPIIMVTGNSEREVVLDSLRIGATDFIAKPVERFVLLERLGRVLGAGPKPPGARADSDQTARLRLAAGESGWSGARFS